MSLVIDSVDLFSLREVSEFLEICSSIGCPYLSEYDEDVMPKTAISLPALESANFIRFSGGFSEYFHPSPG